MRTIEDTRSRALLYASGLPNIYKAEDLIREAIAIEAYLISLNNPKDLTKEDLYGPL
jgi:hypothetical protein